MKCLSTIQIERLILHEGGASSDQDFQQIEAHIKECHYCHERYVALKQFKRNFEKNLDKTESPALQNLLADLIESDPTEEHVFIALPRTIKSSTKPAHEPIPVLAADTGWSKPKVRHRNLGALLANNADIMVRVMEDVDLHEVTLHILAEDEAKYQHVLVQIPPLEGEFISDSNGQIHLGKIPLPPVDKMSVIIQSAHADFHIDASLMKQLHQGELEFKNDEDSTIQIRFRSQAKEREIELNLLKLYKSNPTLPLRALLVHDEKYQLCNMQGGMGLFHVPDPLGDVSIKIFR